MDNEIDRKIDVSAIQFLLVQNRHQTHTWTLIGSDANGIDIQVCICTLKIYNSSEIANDYTYNSKY